MTNKSSQDAKMQCRHFFLLILIFAGVSAGNRVKRKVIFSKNSKVFLRLNGKTNVIPWTEIFAHGWGFRVNYDLPDTVQKKYMLLGKRDVSQQDPYISIPDEFAQTGLSCVFKYICDKFSRIKDSEQCGVFCRIADIIMMSESKESDFFKSIWSNCDTHSSICPHSVDNMELDYSNNI